MNNVLTPAERGAAFLDEIVEQMAHRTLEFPAPEPITASEWNDARPTPDCIIKDYLFADVAVFIAPGGMGKTTLKLFETIHVAIGRVLYGLKIYKPGSVLIVTAEDSREMLIARLRAIAHAMNLDDATIELVRQKIHIADTSGSGFRLTEIGGDCVRPAAELDQVIEVCREIKPVLVIVDPAVSFGVGESRVNDAEQGLIEAARRLRRALNCCVQYIHHSGKQNARDKAVDQYAGRGGSAFADGARMVHVLQSLTASEWREATGEELGDGETGLRLARPKMSYCAPQPDILIRRKGYLFQHVEAQVSSKREKLENAAAQVWELLNAEVMQGRYPSRNTLEHLDHNLTRGEVRAAIAILLSDGRIEERQVPSQGHGGKRKYLHTVRQNETANQDQKLPENKEGFASEKTAFASPPPIGNSPAANQPPPEEPIFSYGSPNTNGEPTANPANQVIPLETNLAEEGEF